MTENIHFIEIEPEEPCKYCGRKKLNSIEKFYRVLIGDSTTALVVCEFCKGAFLITMFEGAEKSYATHLMFYVKRSLLDLKERLPAKIFNEAFSALENYETGNSSASFRYIGWIAEWLTEKIFSETFGEVPEGERLSWDGKLGRLLDAARKRGVQEEAFIYQLYFLKWFRNKTDHPSLYEITAEDTWLGLASIAYLLQRKFV